MDFKQGVPLWQVDAFTDQPFRGNPAAVCILESYPSDEWLQCVASEMNLSETSFVVPSDDLNSFHLRWFTPATEVDLCGHATLAAAHVLAEQNRFDAKSRIRFQTRSGELICTQVDKGMTLDFPATLAVENVDGAIASALLASLGIQDAAVMQTKFDLVVVVDGASIVEGMLPDFNALGQIDTRGVMVTAASSNSEYDFVSRFFAPRCGINEDPVTGSAHCCLAPFWAEKLGKKSLTGYQASRRGGIVDCEVAGDRVLLTGSAITVMEGRLLLAPK